MPPQFAYVQPIFVNRSAFSSARKSRQDNVMMTEVTSFARTLALATLAAVAVATSADAGDAGAPVGLTPGFDAPVAEPALPIVSNGLPWYVAVKVSATAPDGTTGKASSVLTSHRANSAWKMLARATGADNGVDKYSLVFKVAINGVILPPITAIEITHSKSGGLFGIGGKEEVDIDTDSNVYSPWVPIDQNSKLSVRTEHVGSSSPNFTLLTDASSFSGKIGTAGGLAVSAPAQAVLNLAAQAVQNAYSSATAFKNDANLSQELYPLSGAPAGYAYLMRDVDGKPIAKITIEFVFRRSLRQPPESLSLINAPDMSAQPIDSPSFLMLDSAGSTQPILDKLATNDALRNSLTSPSADPQGVATFNSGCTSLLTFLQGSGLNLTDSTFFAVKYLRRTVNSRYDLAVNFWNGCLVDRHSTAVGIKVDTDIVVPPAPLPPVLAVALNPSNSQKIGAFVMRKGTDRPGSTSDGPDDATVVGMLAPAITWLGSPNALTANDARSKLASLVATQFHCNLRMPVNDPATDSNGVTMFLRNGTQPEKVLALTGPVGGDEDSQAASIAYRDPTPAELKSCTAYEKARNGTPPFGAN